MVTSTAQNACRLEFVNTFRNRLPQMGIWLHPDTIDQSAKPYAIEYAEESAGDKFFSIYPLLYVPGLGEFNTSSAQDVFVRKGNQLPIHIDYGLGGQPSLARRFRDLQSMARDAFDEIDRPRLEPGKINQRVAEKLADASRETDSECIFDLLFYASILANGYSTVSSRYSCYDLFRRAADVSQVKEVRAMTMELAAASLPADSEEMDSVKREVLKTWTDSMPQDPDIVFDTVRAFQGISTAMATSETMPLAAPFFERMIAVQNLFLQNHAAAEDEATEAHIGKLPRLIVNDMLRMAFALVSGNTSDDPIVDTMNWVRAAYTMWSICYDRIETQLNRKEKQTVRALVSEASSVIKTTMQSTLPVLPEHFQTEYGTYLETLLDR